MGRPALFIAASWDLAQQLSIAEVYCEETQVTMDKLALKQPKLVNCSNPLSHDNARSHTALRTVTKLQDSQMYSVLFAARLETLRDPPYSQELDQLIFNFLQE